MKKNVLFSVGLVVVLFTLFSCGGEKKSEGSEKKQELPANPINGHEYIDLGLPSGVMWATCNVGATKPEDFGGRYAWGEIREKDEYGWETYKLCARTATTIKKYCDNSDYGRVDNKTILDPEDDVAHVKWGGSWRMPTEADFDELRAKCKWKWTSVNGVYGYNVIGPSGDSIFLPATAQDNFNGYYWSASLCSSKNDEAILFNFAQIDDRYCNDNTSSRQYGYCVRPVIELGYIIADNGEKVEDVNGLETRVRLEKEYNGYLKGGYDIQTTLNTQMMDICRTELEKVLKEKHLAAGWAILMETKTGDIKAIVNLARNDKGIYSDTIGGKKIRFGAWDKYVQKNHALCERYEPGSIFKTVALTAILADGKLTTKDSVNAYPSKVHKFGGHRVSDEMYRDNGTGKYSMKDAMMYSSNISMVQFIRNAYLDCPEQYTNTLQRFGLTDNYYLVNDEVTPKIKIPGTKEWDGYSLNSMSYGYAVEMTAINMVAFYNTIANGGQQMQPRLVKAILNNGTPVVEFPTRVINWQLFPKSVADDITYMLTEVVNGKSIIVDKKDWRYGMYDGTGKLARSELMTIAGKTGTAKQYGSDDKLLSFCGFFPAEAPEYTLIVQIMYDYELDPRSSDEKKYGYGGGNTSGVVFKNIAEKIMKN